MAVDFVLISMKKEKNVSFGILIRMITLLRLIAEENIGTPTKNALIMKLKSVGETFRKLLI